MKGYRSSHVVVTVNGTSIKKAIVAAIIGFFLLFAVSGVMTSLKPEYRVTSSSIHEFSKKIKGDSLLFIFGYANAYFTQDFSEEAKTPDFATALFELTTSLNLDDPRSMIRNVIPGFSLFDGEILVAGSGVNYTDIPIESSPPMEVLLAEREASVVEIEEEEDSNTPPPAQTTGDKRTVFIYHSHSRESFLPYLKGVTNPNAASHKEVNITRVGKRLQESLIQRGIGTDIDTTDTALELSNKGWVYGQSYDVTRPIVKEVMNTNQDLNYLIDVHRDSARRDLTTITIDGKSYAKLYFVIGTKNPNFDKNQKLANEIHKKLEAKYPGLSKGLIEPTGAGKNGKYNQDLSPNALLIEVGGVDNTFEEMFRTIEIFADVFSEIYWQAEKVDGEPEGEAQ
ncbi:Stage II sporulation protein P (SpoIIP) [Bacillus sp. THAF10]|uniref:stage II sporulation protein P n=1 Tax=Bacillus sp. THAF10 TaxID=2587848 RepID=UPI0012680DE8|nr:stage II sporulation protein P [Bacillus sp. THAF10]QFT89918.1 Stage II sporulation protein P (SpoIIP) [Bacillus sp. THAF10]